MPDSTPLRVCVVALTHGQHHALNPPGLKTLVTGAAATYDVTVKGQVYGDSSDEWSPFDNNKTILDYLQVVGFKETSLSSCLAPPHNPDKHTALATQVDLYIFDPLFLFLPPPFSNLVPLLAGAILSGERHFAILIPNRLPEDLRQELKYIRDDKLQLLRGIYLGGLGEWDADNEDRLVSYLQRVRQATRSQPPSEAIRQVMALLQGAGTPSVQIGRSPKLISEAA